MARFSVYASPQGDTTLYLLDVQSDLLSDLDTRVVVPLRPRNRFAAVKLPPDLAPVFIIEGSEFLMETPKLAAVPARLLKTPIASLANESNRVIAALDFLIQGF